MKAQKLYSALHEFSKLPTIYIVSFQTIEYIQNISFKCV
jgi:hypothetical protein